jgi:hypothetical protein
MSNKEVETYTAKDPDTPTSCPVNGTYEFCTGSASSIEPVYEVTVTIPGNNGQYKLKTDSKKPDHSVKPFNQPCFADSGAPVWKFHEFRGEFTRTETLAVLTGIVSR